MLHIGTTGGTIDKDYGVGKGIYDVDIGGPVIGEILRKCNYIGDFEITELMRKDSLDLTDQDRVKIAEFVQEREGMILITHGTDTMIQSADFITRHGAIEDKIVLLLGASQPYSMKRTDADFNLGVGIGAMQVLKQVGSTGVFIGMNGEIFKSGEVEKYNDGIFRRI